MVDADCPPVVSMSAVTGRSPAPSTPTALMTMSAWDVGSSPGSKYWYAPRTSPALFMPVQLFEKSASRSLPSLMRAMAKSIPVDFTSGQLIEPW